MADISQLKRAVLGDDYKPTKAEVARDRAEAEYTEFHDRPVETFIRGAAGAILPTLGTKGSNARAARQAEVSPYADIGGSIAGYAGGALAGVGIPGLLTGVGKATAAAVTPIAGKAIGQAMGKQVGRIAAGAVEGAGLGLTEATNKSGLDLLTGVPGAGAEFYEAAGEGAAFGGGAMLASGMLGKAANLIFRGVAGKNISKVALAKKARLDANQKYHVAKAEATSIVEPHMPPALRGTAEGIEWAEKQVKSLLAPEVKAMKAADQVIRTELNRSMRMTAKGANVASEKLFRRGYGSSLGLAGAATIDGILLPFTRMVRNSFFKGMQKSTIARALMSHSLMKGRIAGRKLMVQGDRYVHMPTRYDKYVDMAEGFWKMAKVSPAIIATKEDFNEITDEIENASMGELETSLRAAMAGQGIPQEYANPQVAQQGRLLDHLKQHAPPRHAPDWVDGRAEKPIPQSERNTFMRRVRAGLAPVSVLGDFVNGQLTREAADTWWQTQPLAASQVADELKRLVDLAIAHGKKFTPKEKRMIGFMIDPSGQLLGPSGNVSLVQMLQMNYANEDAGTPPPQVGGPKPPGDPGAFKGINQNTMDTVQQLTSRAQKRA